jgi:hypothetical protein
MINRMTEEDILEDEDATPEGDTDDEDEEENRSKKRKRGESKGKGKKKARVESSRATTRQSSVATAGRSFTAESGFVDGEFLSNFGGNVEGSSAMVQCHKQGAMINGSGPGFGQGHNYDFGAGPLGGFGGYTNEANVNRELNSFADGDNNELVDRRQHEGYVDDGSLEPFWKHSHMAVIFGTQWLT